MATPYILKLDIGGDIRRFRTSLPAYEFKSRAMWLHALRVIVLDVLNSSDVVLREDNLVLRFTENGAKQLLTEATVETFIKLASSVGARSAGDLLLRLFVEDEDKSSSRGRVAPRNSIAEDFGVSIALTGSKCGVRPASVVSPGVKSSSTACERQAFVVSIDSPYAGKQSRLTVGKNVFLVRIKVAYDVEEVVFDGSSIHIAMLSLALSDLQHLAPSMARTPGWHSFTLENGTSVVLRPCLEYQLHLCLKHSAPT
jgi:hypothetical protein